MANFVLFKLRIYTKFAMNSQQKTEGIRNAYIIDWFVVVIEKHVNLGKVRPPSTTPWEALIPG